MKLTKKQIRQLILEELADISGKGRLSDDSVDDQIDSLLIRFESESVDEDIKEEGLKFSLLTLLEAPADDVDEKSDEGGDDISDSSDIEAEEAGEPGKPPLDIDQFARRVSRLVQNYQNMLDIETVILNRARKYLEDNYGPEHVDALDETLETQFGLEVEPSDNEPPRPAAAGAGPGLS